MPNILNTLFPMPDALLSATEIEVERALLRVYQEHTDNPLRRMVTAQSIANELFETAGYPYDVGKRNNVDRLIGKVSKRLEDAGLIEEPDSYNGKNGFRVVSEEGRKAVGNIDFVAAKIRSQFSREIFHPSLPNAAWNAFRSGDYDTAVNEAFKALESSIRKKCLGQNSIGATDNGVSLMRKAFDVAAGPLTDTAATPGRKERRRELFTGAFGELRNPVAHGDPTIADPLIAVEEIMTAGALQRIVDGA